MMYLWDMENDSVPLWSVTLRTFSDGEIIWRGDEVLVWGIRVSLIYLMLIVVR